MLYWFLVEGKLASTGLRLLIMFGAKPLYTESSRWTTVSHKQHKNWILPFVLVLLDHLAPPYCLLAPLTPNISCPPTPNPCILAEISLFFLPLAAAFLNLITNKHKQTEQAHPDKHFLFDFASKPNLSVLCSFLISYNPSLLQISLPLTGSPTVSKPFIIAGLTNVL